jgi:hypothetical protein
LCSNKTALSRVTLLNRGNRSLCSREVLIGDDKLFEESSPCSDPRNRVADAT